MSRANSNSSRATSQAAPQTAPEQYTAKGAVCESAISLARIDRLRNSMPGKESLIDELIDLFVCDLPKRLSAIAQAVEHADASALTLQAHALRGGAANFGASHLDELCGKLEEIGVRSALIEAPGMLDRLERESARVRDALLALKSNHLDTPDDASPLSHRSRPV